MRIYKELSSPLQECNPERQHLAVCTSFIGKHQLEKKNPGNQNSPAYIVPKRDLRKIKRKLTEFFLTSCTCLYVNMWTFSAKPAGIWKKHVVVYT